MKTLKERINEIDYATEKLGDVISEKLNETTPWDRGYGVLMALSLCETAEDIGILNEVLAAFCGYGIEYLVSLTEKE